MGGRAERQAECNAPPTPPGGFYDVNGRRISSLDSSIRHIQQTHAELRSSAPPNTVADNESDSNADTCVMGKNFLVISATGWVAKVYGFRDSDNAHDIIPIASGVTAYCHAKVQVW